MARKNSLSWSPEQVDDHNAKVRGGRQDRALVSRIPLPDDRLRRQDEARKKFQALGRLKQGEMNQTEAKYAAYLEMRKHAGDVVWYTFEGMKFRLASNTFYTPDFILMLADGHLEAHEVKGHWLDDARVKIKIAAEMYPLRFLGIKQLAKKNGGGWEVEDFSV